MQKRLAYIPLSPAVSQHLSARRLELSAHADQWKEKKKPTEWRETDHMFLSCKIEAAESGTSHTSGDDKETTLPMPSAMGQKKCKLDETATSERYFCR